MGRTAVAQPIGYPAQPVPSVQPAQPDGLGHLPSLGAVLRVAPINAWLYSNAPALDLVNLPGSQLRTSSGMVLESIQLDGWSADGTSRAYVMINGQTVGVVTLSGGSRLQDPFMNTTQMKVIGAVTGGIQSLQIRFDARAGTHVNSVMVRLSSGGGAIPVAPILPSVGSGGSCVQGSTELCNGLDDNCNGVVDEGCVMPVGYLQPSMPGAPVVTVQPVVSPVVSPVVQVSTRTSAINAWQQIAAPLDLLANAELQLGTAMGMMVQSVQIDGFSANGSGTAELLVNGIAVGSATITGSGLQPEIRGNLARLGQDLRSLQIRFNSSAGTRVNRVIVNLVR